MNTRPQPERFTTVQRVHGVVMLWTSWHGAAFEDDEVLNGMALVTYEHGLVEPGSVSHLAGCELVPLNRV